MPPVHVVIGKFQIIPHDADARVAPHVEVGERNPDSEFPDFFRQFRHTGAGLLHDEALPERVPVIGGDIELVFSGIRRKLPIDDFLQKRTAFHRIREHGFVDQPDKRKSRIVFPGQLGVGIDRLHQGFGEGQKIFPHPGIKKNQHLVFQGRQAAVGVSERFAVHKTVGVQIQRQIDAAFSAGGNEIINPVAPFHEIGDFAICSGRIFLIEVMQPHDIHTGSGDPVNHSVCFRMTQEVGQEGQVGPPEPHRDSRPVREFKMIAVDPAETVFSRRCIKKIREVGDRTRNNVIVLLNDSPEGVGPDLDGAGQFRFHFRFGDGGCNDHPDRTAASEAQLLHRLVFQRNSGGEQADVGSRIHTFPDDDAVFQRRGEPEITGIDAVAQFHPLTGAVGVNDFDFTADLIPGRRPRKAVEEEERPPLSVNLDSGFSGEIFPLPAAKRDAGSALIFFRIDDPECDSAHGLSAGLHHGKVVVGALVGPAALPVICVFILEPHVHCR